MTTGHWTDDQLLQTIYGIGPSDNHLNDCADCNARLVAMQANRENVERAAAFDVTSDFLAAQRRAIYKKVDQPVRWWNSACGTSLGCRIHDRGCFSGLTFHLRTESANEKSAATDFRRPTCPAGGCHGKRFRLAIHGTAGRPVRIMKNFRVFFLLARVCGRYFRAKPRRVSLVEQPGGCRYRPES